MTNRDNPPAAPGVEVEEPQPMSEGYPEEYAEDVEVGDDLVEAAHSILRAAGVEPIEHSWAAVVNNLVITARELGNGWLEVMRAEAEARIAEAEAMYPGEDEDESESA